ncbi:MAG: OPT/YSL family transporter [Planctomycetota bacterium]|nr:OPT/YSL family transporter [Planctomycetota bacterium]MDG2142912.1 OPT/YSL family transporter [Planctomycetota bacterium]
MNRDDRFGIAFGVIVSTILASSLVIAGLKAGITPGVSPLVILFAWGAFTRKVASGGGTRFLNIAQVAGSAGMAVTAGVIFTAPVVQILYRNKGLEVPPVDVTSLIILSLAGALIGFGFVGLTTKKFLSDPTLPAPEAHACQTMIHAAAADPSKRPNLKTSLYLGMLLGALTPLLVRMGALKGALAAHVQRGKGSLEVGLPLDVMVIGIGALLTLGTGLLVFAGAAIRLIGQIWLTGEVDAAGAPLDAAAVELSMRWVGGGAMGVAVVWSMVRFFSAKVSSDSGDDKDGLLVIAPGVQRWLKMSIVLGMAIIFIWLVNKEGLGAYSFSMTGSILLCAMVMVGLGAILSLQIGSSASPVSGTVFVTTLVLCATALALGRNSIDDVLILTPLLVGACVAVCTANDSSQDYKTLQLCGVPVQSGFFAQILGLLLAAIAVPFALSVAHEAYTLGSPELGAPQATMFASVFDAILISKEVPLTPVLIGALVGVGAVLVEIFGKTKGVILPAMAFAVGIYLPADVGIAILIGTLFRYFAEGKGARQRGESILVAAGLITGAALLDLVLGVAIRYGFDEKALAVAQFAELGDMVKTAATIGAFLIVGGVIFKNSKGAEPKQ